MNDRHKQVQEYQVYKMELDIHGSINVKAVVMAMHWKVT